MISRWFWRKLLANLVYLGDGMYDGTADRAAISRALETDGIPLTKMEC